MGAKYTKPSRLIMLLFDWLIVRRAGILLGRLDRGWVRVHRYWTSRRRSTIYIGEWCQLVLNHLESWLTIEMTKYSDTHATSCCRKFSDDLSETYRYLPGELSVVFLAEKFCQVLLCNIVSYTTRLSSTCLQHTTSRFSILDVCWIQSCNSFSWSPSKLSIKFTQQLDTQTNRHVDWE